MGKNPVIGRAPGRRLIVAMALSLLAHYWIVGAWRGGSAGSAALQSVIAVRLESSGSAADALQRSASVTGDAVLPVAIEERPPVPQIVPRAAPVMRPALATAPAGPDTRIYLARELDRYPVPVTALSLNAGGWPAGDLRLWVSIDQAGRVTDITVGDAEPPGNLDAVARERLMNTRFSPAYKDDRPVKSRVQLVLSPR